MPLNRPQFDISNNVNVPGGITAPNITALPRIITSQGSSYTLRGSDSGVIILMNSASANNLIIPENSIIPIGNGTVVDIVQYGVGQTTVLASTGVTVNATPGLRLRARYSSCSLIKINPNEWVVFGDLSA